MGPKKPSNISLPIIETTGTGKDMKREEGDKKSIQAKN